MFPERHRTHHFESRLRTGLKDQDISLLWNPRLGAWVVAVLDRVRRHPLVRHLIGCDGVDMTQKTTPWVFVTLCARPRKVAVHDPDKRPFVPVEPSEWLIAALYPFSRRTNEEAPTASRYSGASWADFCIKQIEEEEEKRKREDDESYLHETLAEAEAAARGKVIIHGDL